jgi:hypothetical protein
MSSGWAGLHQSYVSSHNVYTGHRSRSRIMTCASWPSVKMSKVQQRFSLMKSDEQ